MAYTQPIRRPANEITRIAVLVGNYGLANEFVMGATLGGAGFDDKVALSNNKADSDFFEYVKGAVDTDSYDPTITAKYIQWDIEALSYYSGMVKGSITDGEVTLRRSIFITDTLTNVALLTITRGNVTMVHQLDNPIMPVPLKWDSVRVGEIARDIEFHAQQDPATFDPSDVTTYPWKVIIPASSLTVTVTDDAETPVPIEGAYIVLHDGQSGTSAATTGIIPAITVTKGQVGYTLTKSGYTTATGVLTIDEDAEAVTIQMSAV